MDRYGFLAESVTPPREELLKKIDDTHLHLDMVERASDMVIITHSLLSNVTGFLGRHGETSILGRGFILDGVVDALSDAVEISIGDRNVPIVEALEVYEGQLEGRLRGQGFVESHMDALRVASHLLLEAHRSIFESEEASAHYATRSVQTLNGLQKAYAIAASAQA